jgi:hypothetical protein
MRSARRLAGPAHRTLGGTARTNDTVKASAGARVGADVFHRRKVRAARMTPGS